MTTIKVYDTSADALEEKADELDTTVPEVLEELIEMYLDNIG